MKLQGLGLMATMIASSLLSSQSAYAGVSVTSNGDSTLHSVSVEGISLKSIADFTELSLNGVDQFEGIIKEDNMPEIPVVRFMVYGEVTVTPSESGLIRNFSDKKIKPVAPSQIKTKGSTQSISMDQAAYASNTAYPNTQYSIQEAGSVNGQKRYLVTLHPVQYIAAQNSYIYTSDFTVNSKTKTAPSRSTSKIMFIVGEKFAQSPSLASYVAHKESLGYEVEALTVSRGQSATSIRQAVKSVYDQAGSSLEHVVIVGDFDDVSPHRARYISGYTDHYYSTLDTDDYLSDISAPDVGLGRFSASSEEELASMTRKYIRYELGNFGRQTWLSQASFLATNDRWEVAEATHNYAIDTYTKNDGLFGGFPAANQEGGDKLYAITHRATGDDSVQAMMSGRKIINYSGHGATTFWDNPRVTQTDVRNLTDLDHLPFVISNACITGQFKIRESFAETWQRAEAGAIMFWGSYDSTYWDEDDILEKAMYDGIYREGKRNFRDITQYALNEHYIHYGGSGFSKYYWETYVNFGDPSIDFRAGDSL